MRFPVLPALALSLLFASGSSHTNAQSQFLHYDRLFGGENDDYCYQLIAGLDGGYLIVGGTGSYGPGPSDQTPNGYAIKVDATGEPEWQMGLGTTGTEYFTSAAITDDGNYLLLGTRVYTGSQDANLTITKISPDGDVLAINEMGTTTHSEVSEKIIAVGNGKYVCVGQRFVQGSSTDFNLLALMTDDAGNIGWTAEYQAGLPISPFDIERCPDGTYLVCGILRNIPYDRAVLLRLASDGLLLWGRTYQQPDGRCWHNALHPTPDGGCFLTGAAGGSSTRLMLLRCTANGEVVWRHDFSADISQTGEDLTMTEDGRLVILGHLSFLDPTLTSSALIVTDSLGQLLNQRVFGPTAGLSTPRNIILEDDTWTVVGNNLNLADLPLDVEIIRSNVPSDAAVEPCQPIQAVFEPADLPDPIPGPDVIALNAPTMTVTPSNWTPLMVIGSQTICTNVGVYGTEVLTIARCWPNPARDMLHLEYPATWRIAELALIDVMGRKIMRSHSFIGSALPIADIPPGSYSLLITCTDGERHVLPLVVE